ncbi:MAG: PBECR2 nuclease fold domain-containing protein [Helicobacter sp.]|nr:PBECR2 nuclease fold domain-containing protein [Helicobacter sp.]
MSASEKSKKNDEILRAAQYDKKDEILRAAQHDKKDEILRAAQYDKIESQNKAESSIKDSTSDAITKESTKAAEITKEQVFKLLENIEQDYKGAKRAVKEYLQTKRQEIHINKETGLKASLSKDGLEKMENKIATSIKNGFSAKQHLKAQSEVLELFENAKPAEKRESKNADGTIIYRFNAPFENANALLTLKEKDVKNLGRIYSLELESLESMRFNPSGKERTQDLESQGLQTANLQPITKSNEILPQNKSDNINNKQVRIKNDDEIKELEKELSDLQKEINKLNVSEADLKSAIGTIEFNKSILEKIKQIKAEGEKYSLHILDKIKEAEEDLKKSEELEKRIKEGKYEPDWTYESPKRIKQKIEKLQKETLDIEIEKYENLIKEGENRISVLKEKLAQIETYKKEIESKVPQDLILENNFIKGITLYKSLDFYPLSEVLQKLYKKTPEFKNYKTMQGVEKFLKGKGYTQEQIEKIANAHFNKEIIDSTKQLIKENKTFIAKRKKDNLANKKKFEIDFNKAIELRDRSDDNYLNYEDTFKAHQAWGEKRYGMRRWRGEAHKEYLEIEKDLIKRYLGLYEEYRSISKWDIGFFIELKLENIGEKAIIAKMKKLGSGTYDLQGVNYKAAYDYVSHNLSRAYNILEEALNKLAENGIFYKLKLTPTIMYNFGEEYTYLRPSVVEIKDTQKVKEAARIYENAKGEVKSESDIEKEILDKNPSINNYKDENPTDLQDVILSASEKSKDKDEILRAAQHDKIESQNKAESSIKDSTSDAITKESSENLETQEAELIQPTLKESTRDLKEAEEAWIKAFNLKDINEPYIPQFSKEIQDALNPILKGEQIKLTRGSFEKLANKNRLDFIPKIKETIEKPNYILDDGQGILFIKEFVENDKEKHFLSVAKNYDGEWIFSSHTRREANNIKNKIENSKMLYKGFKEGEVAGALDIIESGGAYSKPSSLQIEYPPNQVSGKNPSEIIPQSTQDLKAPSLFGESAEITKTTQEVYGVEIPTPKELKRIIKEEIKIYREMGAENPTLAIKTYAKPNEVSEVQRVFINRQMPKEYEEVLKGFEPIEAQDCINYIRTDFQKLLKIEKEKDIAVIGRKYYHHSDSTNNADIIRARFKDYRKIIENRLNIEPIKEFGVNYAEYYHDGENAIKKILLEYENSRKSESYKGQVAGAFYKEELGDIDVVWGDSSFGLKHILEKHGGEFKDIAKDLSEAIEKGEIKTDNNVKTIIYKNENQNIRIGLSKGFKGKGENQWIITAYKVESQGPDSLPSSQVTKSDGTNLHSNDSKADYNTNLSEVDKKREKKFFMEHIRKHISIKNPLFKGLKRYFYHMSNKTSEEIAPHHTPLEVLKIQDLKHNLEERKYLKTKEAEVDFIKEACAKRYGEEYLEEYLKTFDFQSITQTYTPKIPQEPQKVLEHYLGDKPLQITQKTLLNLDNALYEVLKDTLDNFQLIFKKGNKLYLGYIKDITDYSFKAVEVSKEKDYFKMKVLYKVKNGTYYNLNDFKDAELLWSNNDLNYSLMLRINENKISEKAFESLSDDEAKERLKELLEKSYENKIIKLKDYKVTLTKESIENMLSDEAVTKAIKQGFSKAEYFAEIASLSQYIQRASLVEETTQDGTTILKFKAFFTDVGNKRREAFLMASKKEADEIYTLDIELTKPPKIAESQTKTSKIDKEAQRFKEAIERLKNNIKDENKIDKQPQNKNEIEVKIDFEAEEAKPRPTSDKVANLTRNIIKEARYTAANKTGEWGTFWDTLQNAKETLKGYVYLEGSDEKGFYKDINYYPIWEVMYDVHKNQKNLLANPNLKNLDEANSIKWFKDKLFFTQAQAQEIVKAIKKIANAKKERITAQEIKRILEDKPAEAKANDDDIKAWVRSHFNSNTAYTTQDYKDINKDLAQKHIERIQSEEYQKNLKEWGKDNPSWLKNSDGTPKAYKGFYYRLKKDIDEDDLKTIEAAFKQGGFKALENESVIFKKAFDKKSILNSGEFNPTNPNILQANPHLGAGILSGSVAGIEEDENGNISINPQAFLAGLIGGSVGSKGIAKGWEILQKNPKKIKIPQLPKQQNYKEFKENILKVSSKTQGNNAFINTPQGLVKVHIPYAFFHFQKSGNKKENRSAFNGSLISILQEPNYILKDNEKLYFYKVFLNDKKEAES